MPIIRHIKKTLKLLALAYGFGFTLVGLFLGGKMVFDATNYPQKFIGLPLSYWITLSFLLLLFYFFSYRKRRLFYIIASIGLIISINATILEYFEKCNCGLEVLPDEFSNCQIFAILFAGIIISKRFE